MDFEPAMVHSPWKNRVVSMSLLQKEMEIDQRQGTHPLSLLQPTDSPQNNRKISLLHVSIQPSGT